ncbi:hypothetical protein AB3X30_01020 [Raoultella terrigena]|jgi:hypothetical protein
MTIKIGGVICEMDCGENKSTKQSDLFESDLTQIQKQAGGF